MESVLKKILKRNASLLRAVRNMLAFLVFFIPSSYKYYEAIVEGFYSLSQLILYYQNISNHSSIRSDSLSQQSTTVTDFTVSIVHELSILTSLLELFLEKLFAAAYDFYYQSQLIFVIELVKALARLIFIIRSKCCTIAINWIHETDSQGNVLDIYNYARHYQRISYRYLNQQIQTNQTTKESFPAQSNSSDGANVEFSYEKQTYIGRRTGFTLNATSQCTYHCQCSSSSSVLEATNVLDSNSNSPSDNKEGTNLKDDTHVQDCESVSDEQDSGYTSSSSRNDDKGSTHPSNYESCNSSPTENKEKLVSITAATADGCMSVTRDDTNTSLPFEWNKMLQIISHQYFALQADISGLVTTSLHSEVCENLTRNIKTITQYAENHSRVLYQSVVSYKFPLSAAQCLQFGEVLYVLRPLVYAWMKHSMTIAKSRKSANPGVESSSSSMPDDANTDDKQYRYVEAVSLAASLVVELLSIQLTSLGLEMIRNEVYKSSINTFSKQYSIDLDRSTLQPVMNVPANTHSWHKFDEELKRRKFALGYYLIRSPLFDKATLPFMKVLSKTLKYIPIINTLPDSLLSALSYINKSHFRSSASSPAFY